MKKTALILVGILFAMSTYAQEVDSIQPSPVRKNVIRFNLTSSIFKTVGVGYERVFNDRWSANLQISFKPKTELDPLFDFSGNGFTFKGSPNISGYYITPEVRWYCDGTDPRKAPRGFYLGGYFRHSETYLKTNINYTDAENDLNANFKFTLREQGLGINIGYQLLAIKDRLVFDFLFAGPRVSSYTLISEADTDLTGEFYEELAQQINEKLGFEFMKPELKLENKREQKVKSTTLGYRYAIRIGYAF